MNDQKLPKVQVEKVLTMGDVRQLLMETALNIRDGAIKGSDADHIVACIDAMTRNMQVEINAAKMALLTEGKLHEFGKVVKLGKQLIKDSGVE
jgi:high-affinity nickel permease